SATRGSDSRRNARNRPFFPVPDQFRLVHRFSASPATQSHRRLRFTFLRTNNRQDATVSYCKSVAASHFQRHPRRHVMTTPTKLNPVIFIHGLWIHSTAWHPWIELFAQHGYRASAPGWPGDAPTVAETRANPNALDDV